MRCSSRLMAVWNWASGGVATECVGGRSAKPLAGGGGVRAEAAADINRASPFVARKDSKVSIVMPTKTKPARLDETVSIRW